MAGPGTSLCGPGTVLPESRASGHTGESFCKQMPQVSSQTGQHSRSASADLTLKIGSLMLVGEAQCAAATHPTDQYLLTQPGPAHTGKAFNGEAGTSWVQSSVLWGSGCGIGSPLSTDSGAVEDC